jgi:hypothetical protein
MILDEWVEYGGVAELVRRESGRNSFSSLKQCRRKRGPFDFAQDDKGNEGRWFLWGFDEFHFAVAGAVEDHYFAFGIAEDEDVAVAEVGFFDGFFEG